MGMIIDYLGLMAYAAGIAAACYLPGFVTARAGGASRAVALVLAPALSFAAVGLGGIAAHAAGIRWGWPVFLGAAAFLAGVCALGRRGMAPVNAAWESLRDRAVDRPRRLSLVLAALFLIAPILALIDPNVPSSQADPMFHYNGVNAIVHTGDASALSAMGWNYGVSAAPATYPVVWHALLALFGNSHILLASHAFAYVVIPIVWLVGMDAFVRAALPGRPRAGVAAPIVGAILPYFPNFMTVARGFWPNAIAVAVIPAIYAVGILAVRSLPMRARDAVAPVTLIVVAGVGMGLAHPGAVFAALWPLVPIAGALIVVGTVRGMRERSRIWAVLAVLSAAVLLVGGLLTLHPRVQLFLARPHPRSWNTAERLNTLREQLADVPVALVVAGVIGVVIAVAAVVFVARSAWRVSEGRWLLVAWLAQWLIVFGAYVDGNVFSDIAGIWYHDPKRAMAIQTIFTAPLIALALEQWVRGWRFGVVVLASFLIGGGLRASLYADARPPIGHDKIIDSRAEIELLSSLDKLVPPDSVILGDPTTGIGYGPAYSRIGVVFPQVNYRAKDPDADYLRQNFASLDPKVCEILHTYGIGYYYSDAPLLFQKKDRAQTWPGLYGATNGLEEIASTGGGTLWKITGCGPIQPTNWWANPHRLAAAHPATTD